GLIQAFASAQANDSAYATAVGIFTLANVEEIGTIINSGQIYASAYASADSGSAHAVGILDLSLINNTHITNTGLINAYAQVPNDGLSAFATGILISRATDIEVPVGVEIDISAQTVITNDGGTIWAGLSTDGGATIQRGNAINLAGIPELDIP